MKFKNFKSFTPNAAFPLFALSLSAGLLCVCAGIPVEAQQSPRSTPSAPSANKMETPPPSRKNSKTPVAPPRPNSFSALPQNKSAMRLPAPKSGKGARTLQFTPADAAKLVKRNLLFTSEDQKRVKFLPKSDGSPGKP